MELPLSHREIGTLIIHLMLLVSPAMMQQQHLFYHPRQLYYEAPRLRRFEYAVPVAPSPPPIHYQQQTPHFQLVNYRPSYQPLALEYQQQQVPAPVPAPALPPLYPQPSVQYQQRAIAPPHAELAKYRYEGNYLPVQPQRRAEEQHQQQQQQLLQQQQQQQLFNVPPALFTSDVLHVIPPRIARLQEQQQQPSQTLQTERPRRYAKHQDTDVAESKSQSDGTKKETKYFHDIFMRFNGPDSRSHGHVLKHPKVQERRFESQRSTNRYKGEVIWTDRQGGHGEHRWDLAQGKL